MDPAPEQTMDQMPDQSPKAEPGATPPPAVPAAEAELEVEAAAAAEAAVESPAKEAPEEPAPPAAPACRHEYVRIYQRRIKGLERRLVSTRAYLPVGFKMADFGHLSEGSYCFCTKCRARLFPKRTAADKAQARIAAQNKIALAQEAMMAIPAELAEELEMDASGPESDSITASPHRKSGKIVGLPAGIGEEMSDEIESSDKLESSVSIQVEELEIDALELDEISDPGADIEAADDEV